MRITQKRLIMITLILMSVSSAVYLYSSRSPFATALSPCKQGERYITRVMGRWKKIPASDPFGMCIADKGLKTNLVNDPLWTDRLLTLLSLKNEAWAAETTYYVATTGNDSHTCAQAQTITTPRRTITAGIACLSAGSTLIVMDGTYNELIRNIPSGTSWTSPVTIRAQNRQQAIIQPPVGATTCLASGNNTLLSIAGNSSYIIIDGLVLDGNNTCPSIIALRSPGGAETGEQYHHIRIIDNELKNSRESSGGTGMLGGGHLGINRAYNIEIRNNHIHHQGGTNRHDHCIYFRADDSLVEGNDIHNCVDTGITTHHNTGWVATNITFRNNRPVAI